MRSSNWSALWAAVLLLQACGRPAATGQTCQWPAEATRRLDLSRRSDRAHLASDAAGAVDLAVRWADRHTGRLSGHFTSMRDYGASRDSCVQALFTAIADVHEVAPVQVAALVHERPVVVDTLVVGSFAALCFGLLYFAGSGPFLRRIGEESRSIRILVVLAVAPVAALFWVGAGQFWATTIESIRIGSSHLSNRVNDLPFVAHQAAFFVTGIVLFWATIAARAWTLGSGDVR